MDKQQLIDRLEKMIERTNNKLEQISEGDITFSEAGDWLHDMGDTIVSAMEYALTYVKGVD